MRDSNGFDLWAYNYDEDVNLCEESNDYPFAGYKDVLQIIYNEISVKPFAKVLDIGFGTGALTSRLYKCGCDITGIDFSDKMIKIAKMKMPKARLVKWDFSKGLPAEIKDCKFDYIIFTYSIHHISDTEKVNIIKSLETMLNNEGKVVIGDVAFETKSNLEFCREKYAGLWDSSEFYIVFSDIKKCLGDTSDCKFKKISHCSGILTITKRRF